MASPNSAWRCIALGWLTLASASASAQAPDGGAVASAWKSDPRSRRQAPQTSAGASWPRDCRYEAPEPTDARPEEDWRPTILPGRDLFRPLLADMKEPRFYASYRYVDFGGLGLADDAGMDNIHAGIIAAGTTFGLWAYRLEDRCEGIQVNLFGGIFSQFNLGTATRALINTDFQVGIPVTFRHGPWSGRLRFYHQSSHLGDEFLLENPSIIRIDLNFEAIDALVSFEHTGWRAYAGVGVIIHSVPALRRTILQAGAEARSERWTIGGQGENWLRLVAGGDLTSFQERDWGATGSIKAGLELTHASGRRARLLFTYLRGFIPFGQFFNAQTLQNFGIEAQFEP